MTPTLVRVGPDGPAWGADRAVLALALGLVAGVLMGALAVGFVFTDFVLDEEAPWSKGNPYFYGGQTQDGAAPPVRLAAWITLVAAPAVAVVACLVNARRTRGVVTLAATIQATVAVLAVCLTEGRAAVEAGAIYAGGFVALGAIGAGGARWARRGRVKLVLTAFLLVPGGLIAAAGAGASMAAAMMLAPTTMGLVALAETWIPPVRGTPGAAVPADATRAPVR